MKTLLALTAATLLAVPVLAGAQETTDGSDPTVSGGTLGIGPEVGFRPVPLFGIRANATFLGFSQNVDVNDINYDGDARLRSYGATADLYPFKNKFRLSAGFRIDRNKIDLVATPIRSVSIGSRVYTPEEIGTIEGDIRARKFAPTFTLGVAKKRSRGFAWSLDAGVMLHGGSQTYDLVTTGELATNPLFQADLARERAEIEDKVDNYKVYRWRLATPSKACAMPGRHPVRHGAGLAMGVWQREAVFALQAASA
ncbi:hypothetical protein AB3M93_18760 [Novosphingobium panipatense]|uniref:hypothetical protein n=1 Tax=Novosphingobium panipatense TaxID=428991 RepID=UPI0039A2F5EA